MNTDKAQSVSWQGNMFDVLGQYGFGPGQKDITNPLPSMEEKDFLLDIEKIVDLSSDKKTLIAGITDLIKSKYHVRLIGAIDDIASSSSGSTGRFDLIPKTREQFDLEKPHLKAAFDRLMAFKGVIEYQKARGRAAKPVDVWVKENLIDRGVLSAAEVKAMPMWMFQKFDPRLVTAFHNAKRNT